MKKQIILVLFLFLCTGTIFGQFSLEKFLNEKLSLFDSQKYRTMTDLTKKTVNDKFEKIPIKIETLTLKEGAIMRQAVTTDTKDVKLINKLFDLFFAELSKKITKTERDETYQGTRNVVWRAPDNTLYTLGRSSVMTSLTMVKMQ
jgi:hypothetical protein